MSRLVLNKIRARGEASIKGDGINHVGESLTGLGCDSILRLD
jgi:hypothetical protein